MTPAVWSVGRHKMTVLDESVASRAKKAIKDTPAPPEWIDPMAMRTSW
jgi:hypothetical protein